MTIKLTGRGTNHARSETEINGNTVVIDEPVLRGGTNQSPSHTETAYAALIGCTNVIGQERAHKLGIDIGQLEFAMQVDFDRSGVLLTEEVQVPFKAIQPDVAAERPCSEDVLERVATETATLRAKSKLLKGPGRACASPGASPDKGRHLREEKTC